MDEIARVEKIEVSKDQLDNSFQQTLYEMAGSEDFQKYMKGKSKPPKQLLEAMTMESANRAYIQQTLERLKSIAVGQAAEHLAKTGKNEAKNIEKKKPAQNKASSQKSANKKKTVSTKSTIVGSGVKKKTPIKISDGK
jgi:Ulp1 family protease